MEWNRDFTFKVGIGSRSDWSMSPSFLSYVGFTSAFPDTFVLYLNDLPPETLTLSTSSL